MCKTFDTVPYDASHIKLASHFDCTNSAMNQFLRDTRSLQSGYGKTYVWLSDDGNSIMGYYNIGTGYVAQEINGITMKIGGSAHINYFALDKHLHHLPTEYRNGKQLYISDALLEDCLKRITAIREEHIGFSFVTLCSTLRGLKLYRRNDFCDLEDDMSFDIDETEKDCYLMYLPLDCE